MVFLRCKGRCEAASKGDERSVDEGRDADTAVRRTDVRVRGRALSERAPGRVDRVEIGAHLTPDEAGQKVFEILKGLWAQHMGATAEKPPTT